MMSVNYKGKLLEYCQQNRISSPVFQTYKLGEQLFACNLTFKFRDNDYEFTSEPFSSKKAAEQSAAQKAIITVGALPRVPFHESGRFEELFALVTRESTASSSASATTVDNNIDSIEQLVKQSKNFKVDLMEYCQRFKIQHTITSSQVDGGQFLCSFELRFDSDRVERFQGERSSTIKGAEQSAAEMAMISLSISSSSQAAVSHENISEEFCYCSSCNEIIGPWEDFVFLINSEKDVYFALNPTKATTYKSRSSTIRFEALQNSNEKSRVCCRCDNNIGFEISGFFDGSFIIFGCENVGLEPDNYNLKVKWSELMKDSRFASITRMCPSSSMAPINVSSVSLALDRVDVKLDSEDYLKIGDIYSTSNAFPPRDYQLDVYRAMLMSNCIVIMPTGSGKTLPASLAMARYRALNPQKMVAFIVDRVPLIDQQAKALRNFTNLFLCKLGGGHNSKQIHRYIKEMRCQGVVATAGAFKELLIRNRINLSDFSVLVFDECHHTIGQHVYHDIIKEVAGIPPVKQPRLIGLSASPCHAKTEENLLEAFNKLQNAFLGGRIIRPSIFQSISRQNKTTWITLHYSEAQLHFNEEIYSTFYTKIVPELNKWKLDCLETHRIEVASSRGFILGLVKQLPPHLSHLSDETMKLLHALMMNVYIGPSFARQFIERPKNDYVNDMSPMLLELHRQISEHLTISENCRIIVFVDTRKVAEAICMWFKSKSTEESMLASLRCERIVGQSDLDGITICQQKTIIRDFNEGNVNLLVSTSVIEEGLDVQKCNLVIRLGGQGTLIQFLQSRGRARVDNSKMLVILYDDDRDVVEKIEREERMLERVIALKK